MSTHTHNLKKDDLDKINAKEHEKHKKVCYIKSNNLAPPSFFLIKSGEDSEALRKSKFNTMQIIQ